MENLYIICLYLCVFPAHGRINRLPGNPLRVVRELNYKLSLHICPLMSLKKLANNKIILQ